MSAALTIGLLGGAVIGLAHFGSLWVGVNVFLAGQPVRAMALQFARFAVLAGGLFALAWHGALALVAGALGVLAARALFLRRLGRVT